MAGKRWECFRPRCDFKTEMMTAATGIEYLKLHSSEVHGRSSKPKKPKKPSLEMTGSCVDALEWEAFVHKFTTYKQLAGLSENAASHLLDCLSKEVYGAIFSTYGAAVSTQAEGVLLENIKRLVVRKRTSFSLSWRCFKSNGFFET